MARLEEARRNIDYLDGLPRLIEDYLKELPQMVDELPRIREYTLSNEHKARLERDRSNGDKSKPYPVVPGTYRERTPEELSQLRVKAEREHEERYRWAYEKPDLKAVAYPDGSLEITWRGSVSKLLDRSRWTPKETWSGKET